MQRELVLELDMEALKASVDHELFSQLVGLCNSYSFFLGLFYPRGFNGRDLNHILIRQSMAYQ